MSSLRPDRPALVRTMLLRSAGSLLLLSAAAALGYLSIFSLVLWYDDEGYVMLSLRSFLQGHALYKEVYSHYGPFYFLERFAVYNGLGLDLTHNVNRLVALAEWLLAGILCGALAFRHTLSWWAAIGAAGLVFLHLEVFIKEPGHPQQLCFLLTVAALLVATYGDASGPSRWSLLALAFLLSALLMTKVNLGVYLALPAFFSGVVLLPTSRLRIVLLWLVAPAFVLLPLAVMRSGLGMESVKAYAIAVTLGILAVLQAALAVQRPEALPLKRLFLLILTLGAGILIIAVPVLLGGTSLADLAEGTFFGPLRFSRKMVNTDLHYSALGGVAAAVSLALCTVCLLASHSGSGDRGRWTRVHALAQLLFGTAVVATALWGFLGGARELLSSGASTRGNSEALLYYATPFVWVLLLPPAAPANRCGQTFGRLFLCTGTLCQSLIAFPVFGTQVSLATVLLLACGVVSIQDSMAAAAGSPGRLIFPLFIHKAASSLLFLLVLLALILRLVFYAGHYSERFPLDLPGTDRVRLSSQEVRTYTALTSALKENADTFLCLYGFCSLYFWTQIDPPTHWNTNTWPVLLTDAQQNASIAAFSRYEKACVIYDASSSYWAAVHTKEGLGPLAGYIYAHFVPVARCEQYVFYVRKGRPLPSLAGTWVRP